MDIANELLSGRKPIDEASSSSRTGLYGIFARTRDCLPGVTIPASEIVYVGMTEDSLDTRNHFLARSSGFHSPRRSLGAILKRQLGLRAVPRAPGPSDTNIQNYAFAGDGESRLSDWMRNHLDYAIVELGIELRKIETATIQAMRPPLNLTNWPNPQKRSIMDLRNVCKSEAKAVRDKEP